MYIFPLYTPCRTENKSFYYKNLKNIFTCLKTLLKEFNHCSWNLVNILSFIFSKRWGKREIGSGQDLSNSFCSLPYPEELIGANTLDYQHHFNLLSKILKVVGTQLYPWFSLHRPEEPSMRPWPIFNGAW